MEKQKTNLKYIELVELNKKIEQFTAQYIRELNEKVINEKDIYTKIKNKIIEKMAIIVYNEMYHENLKNKL